MGDRPTQESFVNMSKYTFKELNTSWFRRMEKMILSIIVAAYLSLSGGMYP